MQISTVTTAGQSLLRAVRETLHRADSAILCVAYVHSRGLHLIEKGLKRLNNHTHRISCEASMTTNKAACPRCGQDWLLRMFLLKLHRTAILCPECDGLWTNQANISADNFEDYSTFMIRNGRAAPESKEEIEIIGPLEI